MQQPGVLNMGVQELHALHCITIACGSCCCLAAAAAATIVAAADCNLHNPYHLLYTVS